MREAGEHNFKFKHSLLSASIEVEQTPFEFMLVWICECTTNDPPPYHSGIQVPVI